MATTPTLDRQVLKHRAPSRRISLPAAGLAAALALMGLAMLVPVATGWDVHVGFPPLFASWGPRLGPGTVIAMPLGLLSVCYGTRLSQTLSWGRLTLSCWAVGLCWLGSLLLVDVHRGAQSYADTNDLLSTARETTNVSDMLHGFIAQIPQTADSWPTHVAGHPAGALLFFVFLVRIGLGDNIVAGVAITLIASTIPLAVLTTLRTLGAERAARLAAPFLVLAPAALWEAVSADAVFTCLSAWGLVAFAVGAVHRKPALAFVGGLLFGACLEMSYGLPLLGLLVLAIAVLAGSYRPLAAAAAGTLIVVGAFAIAGFSLWEAYPVLRERYYDGIGGVRPSSYWLWGDLAALGFCAGPVLGAAVAQWVGALRDRLEPRPPDRRVVTVLGGAALLAVVLADLSMMSKAEVERIWLPFVPWLLVLCALLPARWRRPALGLQVVTALLVQHLLVTAW